MHYKFPLLFLLVALLAIVLFQSVSAVYSWNLQSTTGTATAWSSRNYLTRSVDKSILYGVFVSNNNVNFIRSTDNGVNWSTPVSISTLKLVYGDGGVSPSVNPSILMGSDGVLHVVWQDQYYLNGGKDWEIFYRSCDTKIADCTSASNWSAIANIPNDAAANLYPLMVIDSSNKRHIVWQQDNEIYYSTCASSCESSANWTMPVNPCFARP